MYNNLSQSQSLLQKSKTNVSLEQLIERKGVFGFFNTKITIISICLYKSEFILLLSDYTIITYDAIKEVKILEINLLQSKAPFQLEVLFYNKNQVKKDHLLCLTENSIYVVNFSHYEIQFEHRLNAGACAMRLHCSRELYLLILIHKSKVSIYNIINNSQMSTGFSFYLYYKIDIEEQIVNYDILTYGNLIGIETRSSLCFYLFDYVNGNNNDARFFNKRENFSNELGNYNDITLMEQILSQSNIYDKNIESYKKMQFSYSNLTNCIFICVLNKIFIVEGIYQIKSNSFSIINAVTKFKFAEIITKQSVITYSKMIEPYFIIITGQKLYVYFVLDLNKCIEAIEIDVHFAFLFEKKIQLLKNLNLLNFQYDIIEYNDVILNNENITKYNQGKFSNDFLINSAEFCLFTFNSDDKLIEWIMFKDSNFQLKKLKKLNISFATKFLSSFLLQDEQRESQLMYNTEFIKQNEIFILYKSLELIYDLISHNEYSNVIAFVKETDLDLIYLFVLLRKTIHSKNFLLLIEYYYKFCLGKYLLLYKEQDSNNSNNNRNSKSSINIQKSEREVENDFKTHNKKFIDLFKNIEVNEYHELPLFLKFFFNYFIENRNQLKMKIPKEQRKKIQFDSYENFFKDVTIASLSSMDSINTFKLFNQINESFIQSDISEEEIKFGIIENIVFVLNYSAYRISKDQMYIKNIQEMIRNSYNILDKSVIDLLKESKLEEEILLFYYCRGNYQKCINTLVTIYDNAAFDKENEDHEENEHSDDDIINNGDNITNNSDNQSEELFHQKKKSKLHWLVVYVKLICRINSKITQYEYEEYIKWALEKNAQKTIDILILNKKISDEKIDNQFITILKQYGIDPVIYYLKKFVHLENNQEQTNEMINLYTIKISLLLESQNSSYKGKIAKVRDELCLFLLTNKNYNISYAYDKIIEIPICQKEIGIVLIKQNNYEEGIPKLFIDESPTKIILLLFEYNPDYDLIYLIFKKILTTKMNFANESVEDVILILLNKIQLKTSLIIKLLKTNIFDNLESEKLTRFFVKILGMIEGSREKFKIESAFIENDYIENLSTYYDQQKMSYVFNNETKCQYCKKGFTTDNQRAVLYKDEQIYHEECYNYLKVKEQ